MAVLALGAGRAGAGQEQLGAIHPALAADVQAHLKDKGEPAAILGEFTYKGKGQAST